MRYLLDTQWTCSGDVEFIQCLFRLPCIHGVFFSACSLLFLLNLGAASQGKRSKFSVLTNRSIKLQSFHGTKLAFEWICCSPSVARFCSALNFCTGFWDCLSGCRTAISFCSYLFICTSTVMCLWCNASQNHTQNESWNIYYCIVHRFSIIVRCIGSDYYPGLLQKKKINLP